MSHSISLLNFLNQLQNFWKRRDAVAVAAYFSIKDPHIVNSNLHISKVSSIESYLDSSLVDVVLSHLRCISFLKEQNFVDAYNSQLALTQGFVKLFQNLKNDNWLIPVMSTICLDLRNLTNNVNLDKSEKNLKSCAVRPREALENTADAIMAAFRVCAADNRSAEHETKRWGMMLFANQLFKVYFKMSQLHLMKPLIRAIDSSPFKNRFPIAQQVTYKYYAGLKAMMDEDYKTANDHLTFAFERCEKSARKNKQHILIYLTPVRLLLGYMPKQCILEKYELEPMWFIANAVKRGRIDELVKLINEYQALLAKFHIYTVVEKLRMITFLLHKNHLIDMNVMMVGLQMIEDPEMDLDDTHCIVANLIFEGKIKGYISLSYQKLVLSKLDPFPKLTSIS